MQPTDKRQTYAQNYILFFSDLICIISAYFLGLVTRQIIPGFMKHTQYYLLVLFFAVILCLLSYALFNWNDRFLTRSSLAEFFFVIKYDFMLGCGMGLFLFLTQKAQDFSRLAFAYFLIYNFVFTFVFHLVIKELLGHVYLRSKNSLKMLVITTSEYADDLIPRLKSREEWSHEIAGVALFDNYFQSNLQNGSTTIKRYNQTDDIVHNIPVVGNKDNLFDKLSEFVVDEVLIYLPDSNTKEIGALIQKFEMAGITVHVSIDPYDQLIARRTPESFAGLTVMTYTLSDYNFHRMAIKRIMDIVGSLVGLLITIILSPFIAIAIKLDSKGSIFYKQTRIGLNGREFRMYKFRSMYSDADSRKDELANANEMNGPMFKITDDPRVTKVGKFLRRTSLDELPQFYNILIGQMSLVGTRPPTTDEYAQYNLKYRRRLSIKPGLTGLWQVSGRSDIKDFEEVLNYDLYYIDHWSLGLDIRILFQTLFAIIKRKGAK